MARGVIEVRGSREVEAGSGVPPRGVLLEARWSSSAESPGATWGAQSLQTVWFPIRKAFPFSMSLERIRMEHFAQ
jgi:hypothetical protein